MNIKRDRRSDAEKKFDAKLEAHLEDVQDLDDLNKAIALMKYRDDIRKGHRIDPNTALMAAVNLLGIVLILTNERTHIITSKALGFVHRGRV